VFNKAGTYTVGNDLNATQTAHPNCIEIAASSSILNLKEFAIIGAGDGIGIGILIRKGADHVIVAGGDEGDTPPPNDAGPNGEPFPSTQTVVTQWDIGIQSEGDFSVIGLFKNIGGNIFQPNFGNTTAGILFNGSKNSVAGDCHSSYNGQAGVIVRNSPGVHLFNFSAIGNQESGVWFDHSDDGTISTASAAGNGQYGIWMLGSSRNVVIDYNGTSGNRSTGILLGCGPPSATATTTATRTASRIQARRVTPPTAS
jgi:parallel beta-helix repeat protein